MTIDRTSIIKGPGAVGYNSQSIHAWGNIVAVLVSKWSDRVTSGFGRVGRVLLDRYVEVTLQPSMYASLSTLFPYATTQPGDVLYGASDLPLVITPRNGRPLTVLNAAVTQMPGLSLSGKPPLIKGQVKFTGLVANNTDPGTLSNFFTQGSVGTNAALTGLTPASIIGRRFSAVRNSVTMKSLTPFEVDFKLALEDDTPEGTVTVNKRMKTLDASVKLSPTAMVESAYLALFDSIGVGDSPVPDDIVISGDTSGDPSVTIANTYLEPGGFNYGSDNRLGDLTFESIRELSSNALAALWTFGTV